MVATPRAEETQLLEHVPTRDLQQLIDLAQELLTGHAATATTEGEAAAEAINHPTTEGARGGGTANGRFELPPGWERLEKISSMGT